MLGVAILAVVILGGFCAWSYFRPHDEDRFYLAAWGWIILVVVNVAGLAYDIMLRL